MHQEKKHEMICSYNIKNHIYDKKDYLYTPIRILNCYEETNIHFLN